MLRGAKLADFLERYAILLRAGIGISEALDDLANDIADYDEELRTCANATRKGIAASKALYENGVIDKQVLMIMSAGEDSGSLSDVLYDYAESENKRAKQKRDALGKLIPPVLYIVAALGVIYGLLVGVVPILAEGGGKATKDAFIFRASESIVGFHETAFIPTAIALAIGIGYLVYFAMTPEGEHAIRRVLIKLPVVGSALKLIEYSQWASISFVCIRAGIPVKESWDMTVPMMAEPLREGFYRTINDALNTSWDDALNTTKWDEDDQRREWPIILSASLRDGGRTGDMVGALSRAAKGVGEMGEKKMNISIKIASAFSMTLAFTVVGFAAVTLIMAQVGSLEAIQNG